jgi:hypothetical protein
MHDRVLNKVIENEWNRETKSPSPMMQELASRFREVGLQIFRHRRGMLFVSPVFPRPFTEQQTSVSSQVRTIIEAIGAQPRIGRKELADKLIVGLTGDETERAKMALASDLLWLISAGHVIEFNDGSLDLPRAKTKQKEKEESAESEPESNHEPVVSGKETEDVVAAAVLVAPKQSEGGSAAEQKEDAEAAAEAAEKEQRVEAGAPPADEPVEAAVSAASDGSTESRPTEESEIGGS